MKLLTFSEEDVFTESVRFDPCIRNLIVRILQKFDQFSIISLFERMFLGIYRIITRIIFSIEPPALVLEVAFEKKSISIVASDRW